MALLRFSLSFRDVNNEEAEALFGGNIEENFKAKVDCNPFSGEELIFVHKNIAISCNQ